MQTYPRIKNKIKILKAKISHQFDFSFKAQLVILQVVKKLSLFYPSPHKYIHFVARFTKFS